ncbi:hypothetical protein MTR_3g070315 [Medicago truncatula]|uniref:Uncharacterized protein n=1 Tax=Medicago truncatula TaxID=3880 RepID=A0A072UYA3_MEDTR|nr:hypothetical protein MTR_3g070315 [Medicago truncatula]
MEKFINGEDLKQQADAIPRDKWGSNSAPAAGYRILFAGENSSSMLCDSSSEI